MGSTRGHILAYTWNGVSMMSMENLERLQVMYPVLGEVVHCGRQWTWEQWHLQLVYSSKGTIAYHSSSRSIVGNCEKALQSSATATWGGGGDSRLL